MVAMSLRLKNKGFTLLELAIVLVVIGILVGLGAGLVGILTKKAKFNESRDIVKAAKEAVLGFTVKNKRLPTTVEFPTIVRNIDAWGNTLFYYPEGGLIAGDACCSPSTGFTVTDQGVNKLNTAFILLSTGENGANNTGTTPPFVISEYGVGDYDDIVQYVSIDELKDKILACQSLEITTSTLPEAEEDTPYSTKVIGKGGCNPTFSLAGGSLPNGLSLSADGVISGTVNNSATPPGTLGNCSTTDTFTVRLSAAGLSPVDKQLSIVTRPQTLKITNAADLPSGAVGGAYSATLYGGGGRNSYTWSISSGSLPPGLALNGVTGVISGTPTTASIYSFTVSLSDTCNTTSKAFTITIAGGSGGCALLSLTPASGSSFSATVGTPFSQTITVSGGQPPYTNIQCIPANCNGLNLSCTAADATIAGTPAAAGTCTFNVSWQDSCATPQTISGTYTVNISTTPCASFTGWSSSLPAATNCQSYTGSVTVIGGVPNYTWTINPSPIVNGLTDCNGQTGPGASCSISGTPFATPGAYNFTALVADSCATPGPQTTSQGFSINLIDGCYLSGISVRNQTGGNVYYRINAGACQTLNNNASISVAPTQNISFYRTLIRCNGNQVSCTHTYCTLKAIDTNTNCNTALSNIANNSCTFSDN